MDSPPNWNYLLEGRPLVVQTSSPGECSRSPSISVYQLMLVWEAVFGFSEFFFKTLLIGLPISWWVTYKCTYPHCAEWVFSSFWPTMAWPPCPTLPIHLISPQGHFLFPQWEKSSKGNVLLMWKRWNKQTKNGRSTKRQQNWWVQNLFQAVQKKKAR